MDPEVAGSAPVRHPAVERGVGYMAYPEIVRRAIVFAEKAHEGQVRKDGETSFIHHPMGVLAILIDSPWHFTDTELAAAVLHDVIEDTELTFMDIYDEFGEDVAGIVYLLTKPKERDNRKKVVAASLKRVAPAVIAIKLADTLHNLRDLPNIAVTSGKTEFDAQGEKPEDFAKYFKKKTKAILPLIGVLRMHGTVWVNYANYMETRIMREM